MANKFKKRLSLFAAIGITLTLLSGCNSTTSRKLANNQEEKIIDNILEVASPRANVQVGPFETFTSSGVTPVSESARTYASSTILDMPKNQAINIIYDNSENRTLQSVSCLLTNIVDANNDVRIISIQDRGGNYLNNTLSTDGKKISVSSPGGFQYGEVYQIEINDAPYLSFENKDPQIRKLTIEIEDNPNDAETYDIKDKKTNITNVNRSLISNKKQNESKTFEFDYDGEFPSLKKGDIFFATNASNQDPQLDFYGSFISKQTIKGKTHITYRAPDLDEIYNSFHIKDEQEADLTDADILLTEELAIQQFKSSSLARGIVKSLLDISPETIKTIVDIIRHLNINININNVGNRVETKIILKLNSYKIQDNHYVGIEIGHQNITDYTFDFDVKLSYSWIFPSGVDYKVKCIEDTQDIWYFKFMYDHQPIPDIAEEDVDYTDKLIDDVMDCLNGKSSKTGELIDKEHSGPSLSGTRTTFPLVSLNINYFTPLQIKFKIDFYFDMGLQAQGLIKFESHSTKVDFNFSNMSGDGQDTALETKETSNLGLFLGGSFHAEIGLRISLGISILGLYDYLHIEGYGEGYVNFSMSGMIAANIDFTQREFSGYYSIDVSLVCGVRAGLNLKAVVINSNLGYNWSWYLFRMKFDNPLEHWSENAETTIEMDKETLSVDETSVLWVEYYDSVTNSIREKQYPGNSKFSILSGLLVPQSLVDFSSGHTFEYSVEDSTKLEISEDGLIHVKDGTESTFTTHIIIHVPGIAGFISDRTVTINYQASDIKDLYIGDKLYGQYRPQYTLTLPEAEPIRGKEFEYYEFNGRRY